MNQRATEEKKFYEWFTNKKKVSIGLILILMAVIWEFTFNDGRKVGDLTIMLGFSGLICLTNALFSKLNKINIPFLLYFFINFFAGIVTIGLMTKFENLIASMIIFASASILLWIYHAFCMKNKKIWKRMIVGFLLTYLNVVCMLAFLVLSAVLTM